MVFIVFSTLVAIVGNGNVRATICIRCLGCLNFEKEKKKSLTLNGSYRSDSPFCASSDYFLCRHRLEDKRDGSGVGWGGGGG